MYEYKIIDSSVNYHITIKGPVYIRLLRLHVCKGGSSLDKNVYSVAEYIRVLRVHHKVHVGNEVLSSLHV